jgi:hypothetical protein
MILPEICTIHMSHMRLKTGRLLTSGLHETRAWYSVASSGARTMQADNVRVWLRKFYIAVEDWITNRLFFPAPTDVIRIITKSLITKAH